MTARRSILVGLLLVASGLALQAFADGMLVWVVGVDGVGHPVVAVAGAFLRLVPIPMGVAFLAVACLASGRYEKSIRWRFLVFLGSGLVIIGTLLVLYLGDLTGVMSRLDGTARDLMYWIVVPLSKIALPLGASLIPVALVARGRNAFAEDDTIEAAGVDEIHGRRE